MEKEKQLIIRMPDSQHASLKMFCANLGVSMTDFVSEAIERYIAEISKKHEKIIVEMLKVD